MSKDDKLNELNYPSFTPEEVELWKKSMPGISGADILGSYTTDTITLKEIEFDFQNTEGVETVTVNTNQGDLFNGWPEDGKPVTVDGKWVEKPIVLLKEEIEEEE